jgi:hypothetical protein
MYVNDHYLLKFQKLSEKKKAKYKMRCDEMRTVYEQRLRDFYEKFPGTNKRNTVELGYNESRL